MARHVHNTHHSDQPPATNNTDTSKTKERHRKHKEKKDKENRHSKQSSSATTSSKSASVSSAPQSAAAPPAPPSPTNLFDDDDSVVDPAPEKSASRKRKQPSDGPEKSSKKSKAIKPKLNPEDEKYVSGLIEFYTLKLYFCAGYST